MTQKPVPTLDSNRIEALDMMRGLALFGILLVNSMHFQYGLFPENTNDYPLGSLDYATEVFIKIFGQASFYTLFSFLFGYGMALLKESLEQRELDFSKLYWRRMFILLGVGFLHGTYIWDGDILFMYAIGGFFLFFFLKLKEKGLLVWALILLGLMAVSSASPVSPEEEALLNEPFVQYSEQENEVLRNGSYADVVQFRVEADPTGMGIIGDVLIFITNIISVMGMFLLGAYVARKKWLVQIKEHKKLIKQVWWMTLLVGFPLKAAYFLNPSYQLEMIQILIGGPLVAMFYASSIALLSKTERGHRLLKPLAYTGRMSLTNYLMQSIVFTTLFYGYGIGLFGELGLFLGALLVVAFYALLLVASRIWLKNFYMGPFEWFWRAGTYWTIPAFRRHLK
ncbi:DUF418 domain-containing protein [Halalkalibacterium ligniniphilum]|uniref:DUF418 domain-containing protein n=1 Tax=Halalkalibacterium ligniniphilum TaxID=1134413 RepID=UPI00034CBC88|nr:DUF418 domain-containing protein [Halalkalibacterium ligniniphilum]